MHSTTGLSPAELVFGRRPRSRLDLLAPRPPASPPSTALAEHVVSQQCSQTKAHGGRSQKFSPGQCVLFKKFCNNNKFTWGKGTVKKRIGKMLYLIHDCVTSSVVKRHSNQMLLDKSNIFSSISPDNSEVSTWNGSDTLFDSFHDAQTPDISPPPNPQLRPDTQESSPSPEIIEAGTSEGEERVDETAPLESPSRNLDQRAVSHTPPNATVARSGPPSSGDDDEFFDVESGESADQERDITVNQGRSKRVRAQVDYRQYF